MRKKMEHTILDEVLLLRKYCVDRNLSPRVACAAMGAFISAHVSNENDLEGLFAVMRDCAREVRAYSARKAS